MFLCCREVDKCSVRPLSFYFFLEQISSKLVTEIRFWGGAASFRTTVGDNQWRVCVERFIFLVFDHVLGCRPETSWHKMGPRTKGICSLNTYFDQWQLQVYVPKRFTNLMCIICKSYFIVMSSYTAAIGGCLWKTQRKNCTPYSLCDRVPPKHVTSRKIQTGLIHVPLFIYY